MDVIHLDCTWTLYATIDLDRIGFLLQISPPDPRECFEVYTRRYQEHSASIWSELDK